MLQINDFVINKEEVADIVKNSVGFVKMINGNRATIFFIGKFREVNVETEILEFIDVTKTGRPKGTSHEYPNKICNVCHILKPIEEFEINQNSVSGRTRRPTCRTCRSDINGVSLKLSEKNRMAAIKPKTLFVCPICKKASIPGVTASIVIDHDHLTGKAREWICDSCNTGLGRFKDNVELMEETIKYLKKHKEK